MSEINDLNISKEESKTFDINNLKELKKKLEDFRNENSDFDLKKIENNITSKLDKKE